jgi:hypothetical protein
MHEQLPNLTRYDYFYDGQIRRFLLQIVRAFSGFQYEMLSQGQPKLKLVPCTMAKRNRQVAAIQRNLSENAVNTVPMITVDMTNLTFDADRLQNPNHVGRVHAYERKIDPISGQYTSEQGNSITVERLMPRPFTMSVQIDIWTSNLHQKCQLIEQIYQIIYPTFDIQSSDNPLDWSALTVAHPKEASWTSVTVPVGTEDQIDITTIPLEIPMWITPPAKVKRQRIIEQIITNINEGVYDDFGILQQGALIEREYTTPGNHCIRVNNGTVQLLGPKGNEFNPEGDTYKWVNLFAQFDKSLAAAQTQVRIRFSDAEGSPEVIGTVQEGDDGSLLDWQIDPDTLPANTLVPVRAVIDPLRTIPGGDLPVAQEGHRYLLANDLPANSQAWGGAGARVNAIIEYKDGVWQDVFSGMPNPAKHYLINTASGRQLRWTGTEWAMAIDGIYAPGYWRFI